MARLQQGPPTVRFYQLSGSSLEESLRRLAEKALERGLRVCVVTGGGDWEVYLDDYFWRVPAGSFLPHGRCTEPKPQQQPVLLCPREEDCNQSSVVMVSDGGVLNGWDRFDLIIDFAYANNPDALQNSRMRYRHYRGLGCTMEYWVQGPEGWKKQ